MHTGGWDANGAQTKQDAGQSGQFATDVATEPGKLGANAVISPAAEADEHHREDGHLSTGDTHSHEPTSTFYGRSLWQLDRGAANDRIAHQAADVISVRTSVLIWPEHGREHNGKDGVEHANRDLRCPEPNKHSS